MTMRRIEFRFGWASPTIPNQNDPYREGDFIRRSFRRWLINANIDWGKYGTLYSVRLLGFFLTLHYQFSRRSSED